MRGLRRDEQLLVDTIFRMHVDNGKWPTFGEVERALVKAMDVEDVARHVHDRHGAFADYLQRHYEMPLPPHVIQLCDGVDEGYEIIVQALPIILEAYFEKPDRPEIRDIDFRERDWNAVDVMRLGRLLSTVRPFLGDSGSSPDSWHFEILPNIRRYARAQTGRELVKIWAKERDRPSRRRRRQSVAGPLTVMNPRARTVRWFILSVSAAVIAGLILETIFDLTPF